MGKKNIRLYAIRNLSIGIEVTIVLKHGLMRDSVKSLDSRAFFKRQTVSVRYVILA